MVAVYNTFGGAEITRPERQSSNYYLVITAACAVFVVAAVLVAGVDTSDDTVLIQTPRARMQMLEFTHGFPPERNWADEFDKDFTPEMKYKYDLADEADFAKFNVASGVDGDTVTEGMADPYADQSQRTQVPDAVYEQPAPYKTEIVELGEHTLGKPFKEYTIDDEGALVMGKDYEDTKFDKTLNSVPEANPSREWDFLDTETEGGTLPKGY
jgi:hypothetical protein